MLDQTVENDKIRVWRHVKRVMEDEIEKIL